jgi:Flp pilus assembly protein TadG
MSHRRKSSTRRGATTVEAMVVLGLMFVTLFVIFDLGLTTFQYNVLSAAARRVARQAIVHGAGAPPEKTSWGPAAFVGTAADSSEIASAAATLLPTMKPANVSIAIDWPDGNNEENDRVRVRLNYVHHPLVPFLSLGSSLNLQAESTMVVVH